MSVSTWQISLKELLVLTLVLGLGLAAIVFNGYAGSTFQFIAGLLWIAMTISIFVDHGNRRAFAIGFCLAGAIYVTALLLNGSSDMDPYQGSLPTSRWLIPVYELVLVNDYVSTTSGQLIPDYENKTASFRRANPAFRRPRPSRYSFMVVGHTAWALLISYLGGKFASHVFRRRESELRH